MRLWMIIAVLLLAGCAAQRLEQQQAEWLGAFGSQAPPGTIALNDSLYYDRAEVTNFYWLEYQYSVSRMSGFDSPEYRATMPDTSLWYGGPLPDSAMALNYLRHPAYRDYPVVGVTYDQAKAYSKWRSDRVMEVYLNRAGIVPYQDKPTALVHFTIERFYATDSLKPYHHLPYPSYDLPTYDEWRAAAALSDSLAHMNIKRCKKDKTYEFRGATFGICTELLREGRFVINSREEDERMELERVAPIECANCYGVNLMWQIRGNVAELSMDSTVVLGGGWTERLDSILLDRPFPSMAPQIATGFRNVCRWRKWDGARR